MSRASCPDCDKSFETKNGLKVHHGMIHDGSLTWMNLECYRCGESFEKRRYRVKENQKNFCSRECYENSRVTRSCDYCKESYEIWDYRVKNQRDLCCSLDCANKKERKGDYFECENCGDEFYRRPSESKRSPCRFCSKSCKSEVISGENHYAWKGKDRKYIEYRGGWNSSRKNRLEKDDFECQECGDKEKLHVHHKKPYRLFEDPFEANKLSNLITLCESCHLSYEAGGKDLECLS